MIIRIKLSKAMAEEILKRMEEDGLPRELFEKLTDEFLKEFERIGGVAYDG